MKTKCPYSYPLRSRAAMVQYLIDHESYGGWNHPYRKWSPLSWNVKIPLVNSDGKRGDCATDASLDDAWGDYVQTFDDSLIIEDMCRQYEEGEYTTYPGDDQGHWKFCFAGRSGGHMLIENWEGLDFLKHFSGSDDWEQYLNGIMFSTLRTLYRAVCCMDQDFTKAKIGKEWEYQLNFIRSQWEEGQHAEQLTERAGAGLEPCPAI